MKNILYGIVVSAALFLTGCADAGSDQEVSANETVTLDANKSTASAGGTITSYKWEQTQGPDVTLQNENSAKATFTAPSVEKYTNLAFKLTTTETGGKVSPYNSKDYVVVYVNPNGTDHNDTEKPVITLIGDSNVSVKVGTTYTDAGAKATDNKDGNITNEINTTSTVDADTVGTYTVTYNVSDAAGNVADAVVRTVNVSSDINDTEKPVITLNGESNVTVQLEGTYTELGATATDNVDGNITTEEINVTGEVDTGIAGTYTVTYNVKDAAGNAAEEVTRTVTVANVVVDNEKPVITLNGESNVTVQLEGTYTELGATATDNVDGNITTEEINVTGEVDTGIAGTYTVTYNVKDAAGNAADVVTRTVNIIDDNGTNITVESINDGEEYEGDSIEHNITLSATPTKEIQLHYSFENNTADDKDYAPIPLVGEYPNGTIRIKIDPTDNHKGIIFVKGLKEFSFKVETGVDSYDDDVKEYYNVTVGGKTAKGTIISDS